MGISKIIVPVPELQCEVDYFQQIDDWTSIK
jgi:hypothetical protein